MEERNDSEWQAPLPADENKPKEPAQMSEPQTLGSIFFEPGKTFEDLRRKPRFIMALLLCIAFITAYQFLLLNKFGNEGLRKYIAAEINKNPRTEGMSPEDKQKAVDMQMSISGFTKYLVPVFLIVFFAIGTLIYFALSKAFGGEISFLQTLSVWVYSSFPPIAISMLASFIVMFFKSADDIDLVQAQRGLVHANPGMFLDGKSMPVVTTILSTFDLFQIWGWILAAIGLNKVGKLSKESAWMVVLVVALISIAYRILSAYLSGSPQ